MFSFIILDKGKFLSSSYFGYTNQYSCKTMGLTSRIASFENNVHHGAYSNSLIIHLNRRMNKGLYVGASKYKNNINNNNTHITFTSQSLVFLNNTSDQQIIHHPYWNRVDLCNSILHTLGVEQNSFK